MAVSILVDAGADLSIPNKVMYYQPCKSFLCLGVQIPGFQQHIETGFFYLSHFMHVYRAMHVVDRQYVCTQ